MFPVPPLSPRCSFELNVPNFSSIWGKSITLGGAGWFLGWILFLFGNEVKYLLCIRTTERCSSVGKAQTLLTRSAHNQTLLQGNFCLKSFSL